MAEDRGVYSPPPDEGYDARDSGRRGMVLLAVSVVVLLAAGFMAWSAYNLGLREGGRDAPPRIVADAGPFRTEPADPGGFQAPNQDIEVYDTLTGAARPSEERIAPPPEEPLAEALEPAPPLEETPAPAPGAIRIVEAPDGAGPTDLRPGGDAPPPVQQAEIQPAPAPEPPAPPPAEPAPQAPAASGGAFLVQLAALRSEQEARATWSRVAGAHPAIMGGAGMDIQRADLGERGIYYRVRAGGFATREAADAFCNRLKAAGQDCIVVAR